MSDWTVVGGNAVAPEEDCGWGLINKEWLRLRLLENSHMLQRDEVEVSGDFSSGTDVNMNNVISIIIL